MQQVHDATIVTLDINVFVSGTTISQSAPSQVLEAWRRREYVNATSEPILTRMSQVFRYPRVQEVTGITENVEIDGFIASVKRGSLIVPGTSDHPVTSDPEDNRVFACAVEANAHYIVSQDQKDVLSVGEYRGIKTIHPREFINTVLSKKAA